MRNVGTANAPVHAYGSARSRLGGVSLEKPMIKVPPPARVEWVEASPGSG